MMTATNWSKEATPYTHPYRSTCLSRSRHLIRASLVEVTSTLAAEGEIEADLIEAALVAEREHKSGRSSSSHNGKLWV